MHRQGLEFSLDGDGRPRRTLKLELGCHWLKLGRPGAKCGVNNEVATQGCAQRRKKYAQRDMKDMLRKRAGFRGFPS